MSYLHHQTNATTLTNQQHTIIRIYATTCSCVGLQSPPPPKLHHSTSTCGTALPLHHPNHNLPCSTTPTSATLTKLLLLQHHTSPSLVCTSYTCNQGNHILYLITKCIHLSSRESSYNLCKKKKNCLIDLSCTVAVLGLKIVPCHNILTPPSPL